MHDQSSYFVSLNPVLLSSRDILLCLVDFIALHGFIEVLMCFILLDIFWSVHIPLVCVVERQLHNFPVELQSYLFLYSYSVKLLLYKYKNMRSQYIHYDSWCQTHVSLSNMMIGFVESSTCARRQDSVNNYYLVE